MTRNPDGQVVTFYSYKGGTGRTMALANVAWILASNGKRVLAVDWDLESPGLFRFFNPFIDPGVLTSTRGVIDMIREYEWATTKDDSAEILERHASVRRHAFSLDWAFPDGGTLDYLSAGQQNSDYAGTLAEVNWDDFYQHQRGGQYFDALRADMKRHYDYTLIDSRTGHSDVAAICTSHLPDVLVDCFTFSEQGIDGAVQMTRKLRSKRPIRILPVPMRVDPAEKRKADAGRSESMRRFDGLPLGMSESERQAYWNGVQVPYQAFYAYEETLATFADAPGLSGSLLNAYETITRYVTNGTVRSMPHLDGSIRTQITARFERRPLTEDNVVVVSYAEVDQVWAEWVEQVLTAGGLQAVLRPDSSGAEPAHRPRAVPADAQLLILVSKSNVEREQDAALSARNPLALYIADVAPLRRIPAANSAFITGLNATAAATRILDLTGRPITDLDALLAGAPRYPGRDPDIMSLPARNARFTGRSEALSELRTQLRSGTAVVLFGAQSVALQGMGGVGKTQLALEYAYRYGPAYDVVFWLSADSTENLDTSLRDLGNLLNLELSGRDSTRAVLQELSRDRRRWLLIYDNAEEPRLLQNYLPHGPGHVLITSRSTSWGEQAQPLLVDVFKRQESTDHLLQRVATITKEEAGRVAEQLADLPIAIAAAAAWLDETGTSVEGYLEQLQAGGPSAISGPDAAIARTWDLSLNRLKEQNEAAYRLFQLCSVLAPEIALELIYSDKMAEFLRPYNAAVSDRTYRGSLVQQINRLALLRIDQRREGTRGGQVLIHRLVQTVVRDRMSGGDLAEARRQVHEVMAAARPEGEVDEQKDWPRYRILWPHLDVSDAVHSDNAAVRQLLIDRVRYQWLQGELDAGRDRAERTIAAWTEQLPTTGDPARERSLREQLLHLQFNLANLLRDLGEFEQAGEVDRRVLAEQTVLLGETHPHTLMTAGGLAADLRSLGRYAEALDLDTRTHHAWHSFYGEATPRTLAALNNLAVDHRLLGQFRKAYDLDEQVLNQRRDVLGETNLYTLASAACLARDVRDAGDYAKSVGQLEKTLAEYVATRGPDTRATLTTQSNYAVSLRSAGALDKALELHEDAYTKLNELLGPDNPETLSCRLSRALSLQAKRRNDEAAAELLQLKGIYEAKVGATHPYTLVCMNDLAVAERSRENFEAGLDWVRRAAAGLEERLGPEHPYTLSAQMNLAICLADTGDTEGGRVLLEEIADVLKHVFGPDHPNAIRCEVNIALMARHLGDENAEVRLAALRERLVDRVGERHPAVSALQRRRYLYRIIDPHQF
ncbi:FxSxx-COOH system tetratricopeptide repeat protein [Dactylosporangium sp. AC04546]|uniref:FxSxx-COOH system tetratricopeptide repeat protein n=1 Tax=Dactylosporangium sp. AC04546 TaxID=2862460 RepID=UPI001EE065FC|nr:FxSxx-COOH system tetratricopeptide repeat protein [Dactylosporangium sp. AC04546]WVK83539.1 FxSxx-COOH system tetratricopeptide repeat protein [Dactylosporangium sp. AC04546]